MEFAGQAIEGMSMEERMTICNMVVEAGGKNGVIAPDQTTFDYVKVRRLRPLSFGDERGVAFLRYAVVATHCSPVSPACRGLRLPAKACMLLQCAQHHT